MYYDQLLINCRLQIRFITAAPIVKIVTDICPLLQTVGLHLKEHKDFLIVFYCLLQCKFMEMFLKTRYPNVTFVPPNEMRALLTVNVNSVVYTLTNFNAPFPVTALY